MSKCTFIAADVPLREVRPLGEDPDVSLLELWPGEPYGLFSFPDVSFYTDKTYGVYLEWDYTEDRAKQLIEYIQEALAAGGPVELWHVWLMDYYEYEDSPVIRRKTIPVDELTPRHIQELDEAAIWNRPDKMYPERPSFYCLRILPAGGVKVK